jgi:hypothetical protein
MGISSARKARQDRIQDPLTAIDASNIRWFRARDADLSEHEGAARAVYDDEVLAERDRDLIPVAQEPRHRRSTRSWSSLAASHAATVSMSGPSGRSSSSRHAVGTRRRRDAHPRQRRTHFRRAQIDCLRGDHRLVAAR